MGLLDIDMTTPEGQGFNSALMQAAAALLTPRHRGGGMGAAFSAFPQAIEQSKALAQRNRLLGLQEQQMGLQGQKLGFEMEQSKLSQQQAAENQARFNALVRGLPPDQQPIAEALGRDYFKGLAPQAPKAAEPTALAKLIAERDKLPADHPWRTLYDKSIEKATSHAPAANMTVHTGTLTPVEVGGQPAFAMGAKDGTAQIIPGLQPAGSAEAAAKKDQRKTAAVKTANIIIGKVDDALSKVGMTTTGMVGAALGNIPGSSAYDLRRAAETIKANLGFTQLQEMRDLSPTGGALGQVAVQELAMLQAAVSNLDPNQSAPELTKNLKEVRARYSNVLKILEGGNGVQDDPAPSGTAKRMRFNPATGQLE
jgi:hypothetical protein